MNPPTELAASHSSPNAGPPVRGLDALAMMLSGLCLVHCLALPLLVAVLPLAASALFADERFHLWLLLGAVPTSVIALGWGWRRHRSKRVLWLGAIGMVLMVAAAVGLQFGLVGATGERALTVVGAVLLAIAHLRNYQLRHHNHDHSRLGVHH